MGFSSYVGALPPEVGSGAMTDGAKVDVDDDGGGTCNLAERSGRSDSEVAPGLWTAYLGWVAKVWPVVSCKACRTNCQSQRAILSALCLNEYLLSKQLVVSTSFDRTTEVDDVSHESHNKRSPRLLAL